MSYILRQIRKLFGKETAEDCYNFFKDKTKRTRKEIDFTKPFWGHAISSYNTTKLSERIKTPLVIKIIGHGDINIGDKLIIKLHNLRLETLVIELSYYRDPPDMFKATVLIESNTDEWIKIYNKEYK